MGIKLTFLEAATELSSNYLNFLRRIIGESEFSKEIVKDIVTFFRNREFSEDFINFLYEHNCKIVVELNKEEKSLLNSSVEDIQKVTPIISEVYRNAISNSGIYAILLEALIIKTFPKIFSDISRAKAYGEKIKKIFNDNLSSVDESLKKIFMALHKPPLFLGIDLQKINLSDLYNYMSDYGFDEEIFRTVHQMLIDSFVKREEEHILKLLASMEIIDYSDLKNFPFNEFFKPSVKTLTKLAKMVSSKAAQKEKVLKEKDRDLDRMTQKVRGETSKILESSLQELKNILTKGNMQDVGAIVTSARETILELLGKIKLLMKSVKQYKEKMIELGGTIEENRRLQSITPEELSKYFPNPPEWEIEKLVTEYWKSDKYLSVVEPKVLKQLQRYIQKEYRKNPELLKIYEEEGRNVFQPMPEEIVKNYIGVFKDLLEPIYVIKRLSDLIIVWPPELDPSNPKSYVNAKDMLHLVGIDLIPSGQFYRFAKRGRVVPHINVDIIKKEKELSQIIRKNFSSVVSVLVYDVRGSTFMSHKLNNAEKQRRILTKFHSVVFKAAKKSGGFLLKETGDGGIIWFGANSKELYNDIYKGVFTDTGKFIRSSTALEEEFVLFKHPESGKEAVGSAINIIKSAEEFVKNNYLNYREWFGDVVQKEVFHDGMTYALLPPQFKTLFKLGIGISSGYPGRDMVFTPNAFGDPDLTGLLINEATVFSTGRSPERSVVLMDHPTMINMLLNVERFFISGKIEEKFSEEDVVNKLLQILKMSGEERIYFLDGYRVRRVGVYFVDREKKEQQLILEPVDIEFEINEEGDLVSDNGRIKFLYQVIPDEGKT